eukprot:scaffold13333_cov32-Tisochrysis_lutea.AAC.3
MLGESPSGLANRFHKCAPASGLCLSASAHVCAAFGLAKKVPSRYASQSSRFLSLRASLGGPALFDDEADIGLLERCRVKLVAHGPQILVVLRAWELPLA